jgi:hypothetical protein
LPDAAQVLASLKMVFTCAKAVMKFGVLALDYDGTIAQNGALDSDVFETGQCIVEADAAWCRGTGR